MNFKRMTLDQKKALYKSAKEAYYNSGTPIMEDLEFDVLEDLIRQEQPKWVGLKKAGTKVKVGKKQKIKLPIPIFSLDKRKPENIDSWLSNRQVQRVNVSYKLDGAALELVYVKGSPIQLITRGDGKIGGDVSFLIPHIKNIPAKVGTKSFILRCEALFTKSAFQKYKTEFDAARNAASGILNRQDAHESLKDLSIMVLQVLEPNMAPTAGLAWAKAAGFTVVPNKAFPISRLNSGVLTKLFQTFKTKSKFDIDGLVLTDDRVNRHPTNGNPDHACAFKVSNANADVKAVIDHIEWEVSDRGRLKPVAVIREYKE